jgi:hypothetical protein
LLDTTASRDDLALAVRPQAIKLREGSAAPSELGGIIRKTVYLGSHVEYEVAIEGFGTEILVIAPETARLLPPETAVILELQAQGAALVPADQN